MITFWQEGEEEMEKAISAIVNAFKKQDAFGGIAIPKSFDFGYAL
jgi:hypothetical protein